MDPLPTQLQLVMKVTFQICSYMHGMNGVTSEIKQHPSQQQQSSVQRTWPSKRSR